MAATVPHCQTSICCIVWISLLWDEVAASPPWPPDLSASLFFPPEQQIQQLSPTQHLVLTRFTTESIISIGTKKTLKHLTITAGFSEGRKHNHIWLKWRYTAEGKLPLSSVQYPRGVLPYLSLCMFVCVWIRGIESQVLQISQFLLRRPLCWMKGKLEAEGWSQFAIIKEAEG